jgi:hypothetical protein
MQYKIEIYLKNKLFFATDPDTIQTLDDLLTVFNTFNIKFPEEEGYTLDVSLAVLTFSRAAWMQLTDTRNQVIIVFHN